MPRARDKVNFSDPRCKFSQKHFDAICIEHAKGTPVTECFRMIEPPFDISSFKSYTRSDAKLAAQYEQATETCEEVLLDRVIKISENTEEGVETYFDKGKQYEKRGDMLGHRKLKIETIFKYLASKNPDRYGQRANLRHGGEPGNPISMLIAQVSGNTFQPVHEEEEGEGDGE